MKDINGSFLYNNLHTTQQVPDIKEFFSKLLVLEHFKTIVEIGTSFGGLTYILDDIIKENNLNTRIYTFDYSFKDYVESRLTERGCQYIIMDERTPLFEEKIKELLLHGEKTLVLCDGGDKKFEFNLFSNFLKKNDVIMAHDYSYDEEVFETQIKNKYWNWFEISYKDIESSVNRNYLIEYEEVNFQNAVWACYKKR